MEWGGRTELNGDTRDERVVNKCNNFSNGNG